jgi:hypothetical protein
VSVTITLTVFGTATGVSISNMLPTGMSFVSQVDDAGFAFTQSGGDLTWTNATVTNGAVIVFTVRVDDTVPLGTDLTDVVDVYYAGGTDTVQDTLVCHVPSATPTPTKTELTARSDVETPVAYPNPVPGNDDTVMVKIPLGTSVANAKLQVFTTAYRKILEKDLGAMTAGTGLKNCKPLTLRDAKGKRLSNGVYYLVVATEKGKAIGKLLIMR